MQWEIFYDIHVGPLVLLYDKLNAAVHKNMFEHWTAHFSSLRAFSPPGPIFMQDNAILQKW